MTPETVELYLTIAAGLVALGTAVYNTPSMAGKVALLKPYVIKYAPVVYKWAKARYQRAKGVQ